MLGKQLKSDNGRVFLWLCALALLSGAMFAYFSNAPCQTARWRDKAGQEQVNKITDIAQCQQLVDMLQQTTMGPEPRQKMQNEIDGLKVKRYGFGLVAFISMLGAGFMFFRTPGEHTPNEAD